MAIEPDPPKWQWNGGKRESALHRRRDPQARKRLSMQYGKKVEAPAHL